MTKSSSPRPPIYHDFLAHLEDLGFTLHPETFEYVRGEERGRVAWSCWEDEAWLHKPNTRGDKFYTITNPEYRISREQLYGR